MHFTAIRSKRHGRLKKTASGIHGHPKRRKVLVCKMWLPQIERPLAPERNTPGRRSEAAPSPLEPSDRFPKRRFPPGFFYSRAKEPHRERLLLRDGLLQGLARFEGWHCLCWNVDPLPGLWVYSR